MHGANIPHAAALLIAVGALVGCSGADLGGEGGPDQPPATPSEVAVETASPPPPRKAAASTLTAPGPAETGAATTVESARPRMEDAVITLDRYWHIVDAAEREGASIDEIYQFVGHEHRSYLFSRYPNERTTAIFTGEDVRTMEASRWLDERTVEIEVCHDVSDVSVTHPETGASLVAESRLDRQLLTYRLEHAPEANQLGWVVMDDVSLMIPCDG